MSKIDTMIKKAVEKAERVCAEYVGEVTDLPVKDKKVIDKYIQLGVIQYAKTEKKGKGKHIYYPIIESKEFKGLSLDIWLRITRYAMDKYNIGSGLSIHSAREYLHNPWRYNIVPTVTSTKILGTAMVAEEKIAFEALTKKEEV